METEEDNADLTDKAEYGTRGSIALYALQDKLISSKLGMRLGPNSSHPLELLCGISFSFERWTSRSYQSLLKILLVN
jgi:hypothetical protein